MLDIERPSESIDVKFLKYQINNNLNSQPFDFNWYINIGFRIIYRLGFATYHHVHQRGMFDHIVTVEMDHQFKFNDHKLIKLVKKFSPSCYSTQGSGWPFWKSCVKKMRLKETDRTKRGFLDQVFHEEKTSYFEFLLVFCIFDRIYFILA